MDECKSGNFILFATLAWFMHRFLCDFCRNLEKTDVPLYSVNGHKEIINCIDGVGGLGVGEGAPEIATGSRDG